MHEPQIIQQEPEKAYLVAVTVRGSRPLLSMQDSLSELQLLAKTAGISVVGQATQVVQNIDPATFVGSGKLEEIQQQLIELSAQSVIFDDELTPRHQREIEKRLGENIKVLDRTTLILDIFAQHAQTREGSLQVELAQYEYRLPRLTRQWTHLSRQTGGSGSKAGVGLRGPGETQLEVDKREIGRRISKLKSDLDGVRQHRSRHRQQRSRSGVPVVALVGYTNAGKSTLLNAITGADVYVADQLFATLDPTTRRVELPSGRNVVFTDTVGFIQKLPTTLIASFRATLEEVTEADLLLHVVDTSHPNVLQHIEAVEDTLAEIDVPMIPRILVWNKSDRLKNVEIPALETQEGYFAQVRVSAQTKQGLDELLQTVERALNIALKHATLLLPYDRGDILSLLFAQSAIKSQEHTPEGVKVVVQLPPDLYERLKIYQVKTK
ncbi:MAG: GTPase HflX [Anaerolineae bacterium]|jgi:GTP-binding protein HflX|nr:GTPase HflX [Anaerolineae bacterium]